jgi:HlyD family secretion protein
MSSENSSGSAPSHPRSRGGSGTLRVLLPAGLLVTLVLVGLWWFRLSPLAVIGHPIVAGDLSAEVLGTGTLEARANASVGPKIGGLIVDSRVDQGDRVQRGDLLFRLEDTEFRQQVAMADSELATASAALEKLAAGRRRAEAVLAKARSDFGRVQDLIESKVASEEDLEKSLETVSIADADLALAEAAIREGEKRVLTAQRALEFQQARLEDTSIEAPFDALVVRRDRELGDVVVPGSTVFELVSTAEMWISAWVDETVLDRIAVGQRARVVFRSQPGRDHAGAIARIARETDRETRELVVDVRVEPLPSNWALGQRAEVYIEIDRRDDVLVLPFEFLVQRGAEVGVFLDLDGLAEWRVLELGLRGSVGFEVLRGLAPGDVVVRPASSSAGSLHDGRSIRR